MVIMTRRKLSSLDEPLVHSVVSTSKASIPFNAPKKKHALAFSEKRRLDLTRLGFAFASWTGLWIGFCLRSASRVCVLQFRMSVTKCGRGFCLGVYYARYSMHV